MADISHEEGPGPDKIAMVGNESTCNRACSGGVLKSPPTLSGHRFRKKAFALARTAGCALSEIKGEAKVESEKCRFTQTEDVLFTKQF